MADDWRAGDLALCVKRGRWRNNRGFAPSRGMRAGQVHTVRATGMCPSNGLFTLWFEGFPGERYEDGFGAIRFRKIRPHTPDAEDAETIRLLNSAPVKEPVA